MGWDIEAYFDINQSEIDEIVTHYKLDKDNVHECDMIANLYQEKHFPNEKELRPMYSWNEACNIHEMCDIYRTTFIRDDERFSNWRIHAELEKKVGRPFPACLANINWYIRTSEDAQEVANELAVWFPEDKALMIFAKWLKTTSKYCRTYDLSY